MRRHPMLTQVAVILTLTLGAVAAAVVLLYFTGMDFRS